MLPATLTDRFVAPLSTQYLRREGYTIVRTPDRPDFRFGNFLLLDNAPKPDHLTLWKTRWAEAFGGETHVTHAILQWEEGGDRAATPIFPGFRGTDDSVMRLAHLRARPESAQRMAGRLDPEGDWAEILDVTLGDLAPDQAELADFLRWRVERLRDLIRAGRGQMWGARVDRRLATMAALVEGEGFARFQFVETHRDYRRRGLCSHLLTVMLEDLASRATGTQAVIVANRNSGPERLYERLGFERVGTQMALTL